MEPVLPKSPDPANFLQQVAILEIDSIISPARQLEDELPFHPSPLLVQGTVTSDVIASPATEGGSATRVSSTVANQTTEQPLSSSLQGAWKQPLNLSPAIPTLKFNSTSTLSEFESQWPSLAAGSQIRSRKNNTAPSSSSRLAAGKESLASSDLDRGIISPEYPWAAKMNPSVRNLHRVTNPSFMEDGTPKVCIPRQVLLEGVENQKEFIIGQFSRCVAPTGGQVHAVMSRIWGKRCKVFTRKIGESSFLFHVPDEFTRRWIVQRGLWHVDDCLMFVSAWNPMGTIAIPEISTIPVWLALKNIPNQLYSIKGISWIGSGLGAPMLTSKPWLDPTQIGEAKILVEVKLNKPFPPKVAIEDESGSITMVDVLYSWLPSKCSSCGILGHKTSRCLGKALPCQQAKPSTTADINSNDVFSSKTSPTLPLSEPASSLKGSVAATSEIISGAASKPQDAIISTPEVIEIITPSTAISHADNVVIQSTIATSTKSDGTAKISPPISHLDASKESNVVEPISTVNVDDPVSLATITELENMYVSLSLICVNEATESLAMGSTPTLPVIDTPIAEAPVQRGGTGILDSVLGSNKFASLVSSEGEEEELMSSDIETNSNDLMTPFGKRILRKRPVKPSAKAREMHFQFTGSRRGNRGRGRGNRGGSG